MADEQDILEEAIQSPRTVTVDGQTVTERSVDELIKLANAVKRRNKPLQIGVIKLKGAAAR